MLWHGGGAVSPKAHEHDDPDAGDDWVFGFEAELHAFAPSQIRSSLAYIALTLREIFRDGGGNCVDRATPTVRLYSDHSGRVLKLRGYLIEGERRRSFAVLVEEVEPAELFHQRMIYRHGLSPREVQVLALRRGAFTCRKIAEHLDLSVATVKTYLRQVSAKLEYDAQ